MSSYSVIAVCNSFLKIMGFVGYIRERLFEFVVLKEINSLKSIILILNSNFH